MHEPIAPTQSAVSSPNAVASSAADEGAERDGAPDDEAPARVEPAEQALGRQRLHEADARDVVDDPARAEQPERRAQERERKRRRRERDEERRRPEDGGRADDRRADAEPRRRPARRGRRPRCLPTPTGTSVEPDQLRREVELADGVDEEDRPHDLAEEVRGRRARWRTAASSGGSRGSEGPPRARGRGAASGCRSGRSSFVRMRARNPAEPRKLTASTRIANGAVIAPTRTPARPGPAMNAPRSADLELRVAVHELVLPDERRQVGLVGDVEEDRADPDAEGDDVQLPDRERVERVRDRDRREQEPRDRGRRRRGWAGAAGGRPRRRPAA